MTRYVRTRNERDRERIIAPFGIKLGEEQRDPTGRYSFTPFVSAIGSGYIVRWPNVESQIFIFYIN